MPRPTLIFELFSFHHALSTFLITLLAVTFSIFYPNPEVYWLLLSSILLSQAGLGAELNWWTAWQLLAYLLYALIAAIIVSLLSLAAPYFFLALIILTLTTFLTNALGWQYRRFFFPAFAINVLAILTVFYPADLKTAAYRFALILLGGFLVFIIRLVFFFYQRPRRSLYAWIVFLQKLKQLYRLIFDATRPEDEIQFQAAWCDCLSAMEWFKRLHKTHHNLEKIWDLTLSLGSLRYRITDKHLLSMSKKEFQDISQALISILDQAIKKSPAANYRIDLQPLETAIERLDELYQSMLQAVAPEPLVLLLFIQDLHALKEELDILFLQPILTAPRLEKRVEAKKTPNLRHAYRGAFAVAVALLISHYFSSAHSFWLVLIATLVTQAEVGLPLHQGLQRCLWIILILVLSAQAITSLPAWGLFILLITATTLFAYWYAYTSRRYLSLHLPLLALMTSLLALSVPAPAMQMTQLFDVLMGAALGLFSNVVIFPDKPDLDFAARLLPLLRHLSTYLAELQAFFLKQAPAAEDTNTRAIVENFWANRDIYFPVWVFEPGYNPMLRAGQYYFVVHLGQVTEILFAMNHFARHHFPADLLEPLQTPINDSIIQTQALFKNLMHLLEGKNIALPQTDYIEDIVALEKHFQDKVNLNIELLDLSRDHAYLAAFIRYLKDLRQQLLQLAAMFK